MLSYQMCYCLKVALFPICSGQSKSFIIGIFPLMVLAHSAARPVNCLVRSFFLRGFGGDRYFAVQKDSLF